MNGIPVVMFEGLMTNIERRIQLFPFVKKDSFNVRALGSLEAENFFSGFQDLDPKGSGVLRPNDVSAAISTACELTEDRFGPNRYILANAMLQMKLKKIQGCTIAFNATQCNNMKTKIKNIAYFVAKGDRHDIGFKSLREP